MDGLHALTHVFQHFGAFVRQQLVPPGADGAHQFVQFRDAAVVEPRPRLYLRDKPNFVQRGGGIWLCLQVSQVVAQVSLQLDRLVKDRDLIFEEALHPLHLVAAVVEIVFLIYKGFNEGDVVLALGKHLLAQAQGALHSGAVGVAVVVVAGIQRSIMLALRREFLGDEPHKAVLVLRHIHHIKVVAQVGAGFF